MARGEMRRGVGTVGRDTARAGRAVGTVRRGMVRGGRACGGVGTVQRGTTREMRVSTALVLLIVTVPRGVGIIMTSRREMTARERRTIRRTMEVAAGTALSR